MGNYSSLTGFVYDPYKLCNIGFNNIGGLFRHIWIYLATLIIKMDTPFKVAVSMTIALV